ncbi:MAG: hypothetical protein V1740_02995 [Candidatus Woesearchaeota archaeon]
MRIHDFNESPVIEDGLVRIIKGFEPAGVLECQKAEVPTYLYSSSSGCVHTHDQNLITPNDCVIMVQPGACFSFDSTREGRAYVFQIIGDTRYQPDAVSDAVDIDRSEMNHNIYESRDGSITIYPDQSRCISGRSKKSGWFTHAKKGAALAIGEVYWKNIPKREQFHYHNRVSEFWIPMLGACLMQVGDEQVWVEQNQVLVIDPECLSGSQKYHAIVDIRPDQILGVYSHLSLNWPSMPGDPAERIVKSD